MLHVETDASGSGLGATYRIGGTHIGATAAAWSHKQSLRSSNWRELKAATTALEFTGLPPHARTGTTFTILSTDNTTCQASLAALFSRSQTLQGLVTGVHRGLPLSRLKRLACRWIPGESNVDADRLSRLLETSMANWTLTSAATDILQTAGRSHGLFFTPASWDSTPLWSGPPQGQLRAQRRLHQCQLICPPPSHRFQAIQLYVGNDRTHRGCRQSNTAPRTALLLPQISSTHAWYDWLAPGSSLRIPLTAFSHTRVFNAMPPVHDTIFNQVRVAIPCNGEMPWDIWVFQ